MPGLAGMAVIGMFVALVVRITPVDQHREDPPARFQFLDQNRIAIADIYKRDTKHTSPGQQNVICRKKYK
jgi:hypothetical protein